jgi:hypothetical protein
MSSRIACPAAALACALVPLLAGCGGKDYSGAGASKQEKQKVVDCSSPQIKLGREPQPKRIPIGQAFTLDFSKATANATRVRLKVKDAKVVSSVKERFNDKGVRRAPAGYGFVVVKYEFTNLGSKKMEAANSVSNVMLARGDGGKAWQRVDRAEDCSTVSPSLALPEKAQSPEADVRPGKGYTTIVVYSVPRPTKQKLSWYGVGHEVPLRLGK